MKLFDINNDPKIEAGFKVPENYFEDFTDKVMGRLPAGDVKVIPMHRKYAVWMYAAAVLLVALCVSFYFKLNTDTQPDTDAIESYLVYQTNINSYDIAEELNANDIAELEKSINTISDDAIEDYFSGESEY